MRIYNANELTLQAAKLRDDEKAQLLAGFALSALAGFVAAVVLMAWGVA